MSLTSGTLYEAGPALDLLTPAMIEKGGEVGNEPLPVRTCLQNYPASLSSPAQTGLYFFGEEA